jgi:phosphoglycolate phosphatase
MSPDVIVFDFDGTIVNSMPFLTSIAVELLTEVYQMEPQDARQAYVSTCGLPFVKQMEIIWPNDPRNPAVVNEFERRKREKLLEFALFPDVRSAVEQIRKQGIKVCVSSGNADELIAQVLSYKQLKVDLVMGYRPGFEKGPDHFRYAQRQFGARPEDVVFVGDSHQDGLKAQRAGIGFIARAGLLTPEEIGRLLPGVPVISSLDEILPLVGIQIARGRAGGPQTHPSY